MKIHIADSSNADKLEKFTNAYSAEVAKAYADARPLLSFGSEHLNFFVQPSESVIAETGVNGQTINSEFIVLKFDENLELDEEVILGNVRSMVFHEMNHAARFNLSIWHKTPLDMCLFEGLATVFEREHAGSQPLWGRYDKTVISEWINEIKDLEDGILSNDYRFEHPDGRRWISYKVGAYIIDEAMSKSGKSVVELTQMQCKDILDLAGV